MADPYTARWLHRVQSPVSRVYRYRVPCGRVGRQLTALGNREEQMEQVPLVRSAEHFFAYLSATEDRSLQRGDPLSAARSSLSAQCLVSPAHQQRKHYRLTLKIIYMSILLHVLYKL